MEAFKHRIFAILGATALLTTGNASAAPEINLPKVVQFNRDIRPILADNCYACHGPDKDKRKAKLRLDTKEGLFTAGKDAAPIVPGKPDASEIYRRILSNDPDEVM